MRFWKLFIFLGSLAWYKMVIGMIDKHSEFIANETLDRKLVGRAQLGLISQFKYNGDLSRKFRGKALDPNHFPNANWKLKIQLQYVIASPRSLQNVSWCAQNISFCFWTQSDQFPIDFFFCIANLTFFSQIGNLYKKNAHWIKHIFFHTMFEWFFDFSSFTTASLLVSQNVLIVETFGCGTAFFVVSEQKQKHKIECSKKERKEKTKISTSF